MVVKVTSSHVAAMFRKNMMKECEFEGALDKL